MAKGLNKKELKEWKERLNVSEKKYKAESKDILETGREYYKGNQKNNKNNDDFRDNAIANMVYTNVSTIVPSLVIKNPRIYATAKKKPFRDKGGKTVDTVAISKGFEILMNYYYGELRLKRQTKKCLYDALLSPWGIMKLGYTTKTEKIKNGKELEINEVIKEESIFATRISPKDFRVDPKAKDHLLEDAEWVAFRWEKTLEDIKDDPDFSNTANLKTNKPIDIKFNGIKSSQNVNSDEDVKDIWNVVEGWTIWDKKRQQIIDIVLEHNKELRLQKKWPWNIDGFPVEILYFNEKPDELYPLSDIETYIREQDELNLMRSIQLDGLRRMSEQKWLSRKDAIDPDEAWKLTKGGSGTIAEINGNPVDALVPVKNNTVSQDVLIATRMLKSDIRERSGVAQFERGVAEKFDTATEASLIQQGVSIAREDRRDIIEDFTVRIIKKLSIILQQTLTEITIPLSNEQIQELNFVLPEKIEKIVGGREGQDLVPWLTLSKEDLKGDYGFKLEIGSMQPINKETRKRDTIQLANLLSGNPFINPMESLKRIFEAFEVRDFEKLLRDPQQVREEQRAAQQAEQQVESEKEILKRRTDLQKTEMKNQTNKEVTSSKNQTAQAIAVINALAQRNRGNR